MYSQRRGWRWERCWQMFMDFKKALLREVMNQQKSGAGKFRLRFIAYPYSVVLLSYGS